MLSALLSGVNRAFHYVQGICSFVVSFRDFCTGFVFGKLSILSLLICTGTYINFDNVVTVLDDEDQFSEQVNMLFRVVHITPFNTSIQVCCTIISFETFVEKMPFMKKLPPPLPRPTITKAEHPPPPPS